MSDDEGERAPPPIDGKPKRQRMRDTGRGAFVGHYISEDGKYTFMILEASEDSVTFKVRYNKETQTEIARIFRRGDILCLKLLDDGINSATFEFEVESTDGAFTARSAYFRVTATPIPN